MKTIEEIIKSKIKPKEKTAALVELVSADAKQLEKLVAYSKTAKDSEKGTCFSVLTEISKAQPKSLRDYIDYLIEHLDYKAPRVKWEASETIAALAKDFPAEAAKAVPRLLVNTKDEGTVVRWSAAFALTAIAEHVTSKRKDLLTVFEQSIKTEEQNGVKKIYLKSLKKLQSKN